jgi:hypothetical protein
MDIEMLREILAAMEAAGGDAKQMFVWYLLLTELPGFILACMGWSVLVYFITKASTHLRQLCCSAKLHAAIGGRSGDEWMPGDLERAEKCLREHYNGN